jgi:molecular chaperone GrpE
MSALLPVMDDFERGLKNLGDQADEGMRLIYGKLESTLKNKGLKPMEDTTGKSFDVETMEAITRIPAPDKKLKGKVVDQIEKGYQLGNKIIRYAKVVVGE